MGVVNEIRSGLRRSMRDARDRVVAAFGLP
jgi:hypothetical protein